MEKVWLYILLSVHAFTLFGQQGLKGDYYNGKNFNQKVFTRIDSKIDFTWDYVAPGRGMMDTDYSVRWTGKLLAPQTGQYEFYAIVDDGIRVWVGGVQILDDWGPNNHKSISGSVKMVKDQQYDLRVEYFNGILEGQIKLQWQLPDDKKSTSWFNTQKPKVINSKYFLQPDAPVAKPIQTAAIIDSPKIVAIVKELPEPMAVVEEKVEVKKQMPAKSQVNKPTILILKAKLKDSTEKYIPKSVFFEAGESEILAPSFPALTRLAEFLRRNPAFKVSIYGHTDLSGNPEANLELSQDRADNVRSFLNAKGVEKGRMKTRGFGESRPLTGGDSAISNPRNRRVEFIIK